MHSFHIVKQVLHECENSNWLSEARAAVLSAAMMMVVIFMLTQVW